MASLITFEGIEHCGKSTQARELFNLIGKELKEDVLMTREPGGTKIGLVFRKMLQDPNSKLAKRAEEFLFMADRAQHFEEIIIPSLEAGKHVICDRCLDSTFAYQGFGRGKKSKDILDLINKMSLHAMDQRKPDLTIWLDVSVEEAFAREGDKEFGEDKDRFEAEAKEFHESVRQGFEEAYNRNRDRFVRIDASQSEEEVTEAVLQAFKTWKKLGNG